MMPPAVARGQFLGTAAEKKAALIAIDLCGMSRNSIAILAELV